VWDGLKTGVRERGAGVSGGIGSGNRHETPGGSGAAVGFQAAQGLTGCGGVRGLLTAGTGNGYGAVSDVQKAGEAAYAAGTRALVTFGRSVQPSVC
jgi:hypothetical protein